MGYLRSFLIDKKFNSAVAEVDSFMSDNDIDNASMIQKVIFDREIFKENDDAIDWLSTHYFKTDEIDVTETVIESSQFDRSEFVESTLTTVELATGVTCISGVLKQDTVQEIAFLSLRNHDKSIKFSTQLPHIIELAKVVKGYHQAYGDVEITEKMLQQFEENFRSNVVGVDISIDFDHDQGKAAGWLKDVFVSIDGQTLFGEVVWTPKGAQSLGDKDFRYFSPEFTLNYTHPHTGESHGATLLGGGLVNRPFLKMGAIVSLKDKQKEVNVMDTIKLSEHKEVVSKFEKEIMELKLSEEKAKNIVAKMSDENKSLSEKLDKLEKDIERKEKEAKHEKLFSEGKINAAQLKALNEGKDMLEVLSLSENTLSGKAQGVSGSNKNIQLSEADLRACKALGISEEDYVKYNS